jgi:uncharacterized circularly permuted ATP-grasp superfamily protein/uncharacterized alpha-E superfamily protein
LIHPVTTSLSYDELHQEDGAIRPHWKVIQDGLDALGPVVLARRWEEARRLIRDNGITYAGPTDPGGVRRPWELDPIPAVLPDIDWDELQVGLCQRIFLLERILDDLYGPQELIKSGTLPPYLVFADPHFLRPCVGLCVPPGSRLLMASCDVLRDNSGRWWVIRDRTQSPSGFGYILENRLVVARMFGELFRESKALPLAPFFQGLRRRLSEFAECADSDKTVLLSGGPSHAGYFEDAYLAQYLGCTLVEAGDLTVRGSQVYLKMLDGLQKVGSILRRVRDVDSDPLELQSAGWSGVAGLTQAVRAGNVIVTNGLGSGLLESPGLSAYLDDCCRFLLGEPLKIPSLPSGWCGQPEKLAWVRENFDQMVIRRTTHRQPTAFPNQQRLWFVSNLDSQQREQLWSAIEANPRTYAGQLYCRPSSFPSLAAHQLAAKSGHFRFFLGAGDSGFPSSELASPIAKKMPYNLLPGGLVRTRQESVRSDQALIGSKDLWCLGEQRSKLSAIEQQTLPPSSRPWSGSSAPKPLILTRSGGDLPSRSADNFYWLGRYVERLEFLVRAARVALKTVIEFPHLQTLETQLLSYWPCFWGGTQLGNGKSLEDPKPLSVWQQVAGWIRDGQGHDGLLTLLSRTQALSGSLSDRLSSDSLQVIHNLRSQPQAFREPNHALQYLETLSIPLWAWSGIVAQSLHRGHGHRFLEIGHSLERAWQSRSLLYLLNLARENPDLSQSHILLEFALEVADSSRVYRRRYQTRLETPAALDLLLVDAENPRSIAYQLQRLKICLDGLPREVWQEGREVAELTTLQLQTQVRLFSCREGDIAQLQANLSEALQLIVSDLSRRYLTHLVPKQQRAATGGEDEWL